VNSCPSRRYFQWNRGSPQVTNVLRRPLAKGLRRAGYLSGALAARNGVEGLASELDVITAAVRADHVSFLIGGRICRFRKRPLAGMAEVFALRHMGLPAEVQGNTKTNRGQAQHENDLAEEHGSIGPLRDVQSPPGATLPHRNRETMKVGARNRITATVT
jgi:hypothetical protein